MFCGSKRFNLLSLVCCLKPAVLLKPALFFAGLTLLASSAKAEEVWTLVPGRTSIGFTVKHFVLMSVKGRFKDYKGQVVTPSTGDFSKASVDVSIPVSSVFTGNSDRDEHLKTPDFFNVSTYPDMRFHSTQITPKGGNQFEMKGLLTIRGISKPVTLDVEQVATKTLSNGSIRSDFVATGAVNRYDYGLRWNKLTEAGSMVVDETVKITLEVSLMKSNPHDSAGNSSLTLSTNSVEGDEHS